MGHAIPISFPLDAFGVLISPLSAITYLRAYGCLASHLIWTPLS